MKYVSRRVVFLEVLVWINRNFTYLYSDKRLGGCRALLILTQFTRKLKRCLRNVVEDRFKHYRQRKGKRLSYEGRFIANKDFI